MDEKSMQAVDEVLKTGVGSLDELNSKLAEKGFKVEAMSVVLAPTGSEGEEDKKEDMAEGEMPEADDTTGEEPPSGAPKPPMEGAPGPMSLRDTIKKAAEEAAAKHATNK